MHSRKTPPPKIPTSRPSPFAVKRLARDIVTLTDVRAASHTESNGFDRIAFEVTVRLAKA
jgi:hypothetical protein